MKTTCYRIFTGVLLYFAFCLAARGQASVNQDGTPPSPSAILEIKSDSLGLLPPRLDYNARPAGAVAGLLAYFTVNAPSGSGLYYFDGIRWLKITTTGSGIGQWSNGGVVFNLNAEGTHGLAATTVSQGQALWGCDSTLIGPGAQYYGLGEGDLNTAAIVAGCSQTTFAAKICDTLTLAGYTDWYLPAQDELDSLLQHRNVIPDLISNAWYWTSTEWDNTGALFIQNDPAYYPYWICSKSYNFLYVRCIRKF